VHVNEGGQPAALVVDSPHVGKHLKDRLPWCEVFVTAGVGDAQLPGLQPACAQRACAAALMRQGMTAALLWQVGAQAASLPARAAPRPA